MPVNSPTMNAAVLTARPTATPRNPAEQEDGKSPAMQVAPMRVSQRYEPVKLLFGGDVVEDRWGDNPGWHPPLAETFVHLLPLFRSMDLVYFNAEGGLCDPMTDDLELTPRGKDVLWIDPASLLEIQSRIGQTRMVLGQANNHSMNLGDACRRYGQDLLKTSGVRVVGVGENLDAARQPFVVEIHNTRIGILAYADTDVTIDAWIATPTQSGIAPMDVSLLEEDLLKLRPHVDFLIVTMHSGKEFESLVNQRQATFALTAMRHGADLVIGHGPHVIQGALELSEGPIYFSLGNGMMDQCFPKDYAFYWEEVRYNVWLEVEILGSEIKAIRPHTYYSERCMLPEPASLEEVDFVERRLSSPEFFGDWPWLPDEGEKRAKGDSRLETLLNDF